jgi:hypothetical protein
MYCYPSSPGEICRKMRNGDYVDMNNKLSVAVALVAGLVGGMLTRYIGPPVVFAQAPVQTLPAPPGSVPPAAKAPIATEIQAHSFSLVDEHDHVAGTFSAESLGLGRSRIVLRDAYGHQIWSAGGSALRPLAADVR